MGALDELCTAAMAAARSKATPNYAMLRAVFQPPSAVEATISGMGTGDGDGDGTDDVGAALDATLDGSQRGAVSAALGGSWPLQVIQGPPGTGKTAVAVEVVRRAVGQGKRVLVCAPSNMAVDGLSLRLASADDALRLVRLGNPERIDAAALTITAEAVGVRCVAEVEANAARALKEELRELRRDDSLSGPAKVRMRNYLQREARRAAAKRAGRPASTVALETAQVVLCTTTGAAEAHVTTLPPFDLVIVDEAAAASAPNAWLPLLRGRRGVLVGDPMQLPPTLLSREAAVVEGGLGRSLMEMVREAQPAAHTLLTTQWRMHEGIASWSSESFYGGRVTSHPSVARRTLRGMTGVAAEPTATAVDAAMDAVAADALDLPMVGLRVTTTSDPGSGSGGGGEVRAAGGSLVNHDEAIVAVRYAMALLRAGVPAGAVALTSPYAAQVKLLQQTITRQADAAEGSEADGGGGGGGDAALWRALADDAEVATVDSFQGREADAVILSLVRSNAAKSVGFLADRRRLNVAVTRARRHVAFVCDDDTVRAGEPLLASLMEQCAAVGVWHEVEA